MQTSVAGQRRAAFGTAAIFLTVSVIGWILLTRSQAEFANFVMPGDPGPFFIGKICLAVITFAGIAMIGRGCWLVWNASPPADADDPPERHTLGDWLLPAGFTATLLVMPLLMRSVGSTTAIAIFSLAWVLVLETRRKGFSLRALVLAIAAAAGAAAFVHVVFIRLLNVPLPS